VTGFEWDNQQIAKAHNTILAQHRDATNRLAKAIEELVTALKEPKKNGS
jgi:hypothetical protein